jgi:hypothetical protein
MKCRPFSKQVALVLKNESSESPPVTAVHESSQLRRRRVHHVCSEVVWRNFEEVDAELECLGMITQVEVWRGVVVREEPKVVAR